MATIDTRTDLYDDDPPGPHDCSCCGAELMPNDQGDRCKRCTKKPTK